MPIDLDGGEFCERVYSQNGNLLIRLRMPVDRIHVYYEIIWQFLCCRCHMNFIAGVPRLTAGLPFYIRLAGLDYFRESIAIYYC